MEKLPTIEEEKMKPNSDVLKVAEVAWKTEEIQNEKKKELKNYYELHKKQREKIKADEARLLKYNMLNGLTYWRKKKKNSTAEEWKMALFKLNQKRPDFCEFVINRIGLD